MSLLSRPRATEKEQTLLSFLVLYSDI